MTASEETPKLAKERISRTVMVKTGSESSRTGTLPRAPEVRPGWMKETVRPLWKVKYSVKAKDCHSPASKPPRPDELPEEMLAPPSRECLGEGKC